MIVFYDIFNRALFINYVLSVMWHSHDDGSIYLFLILSNLSLKEKIANLRQFLTDLAELWKQKINTNWSVRLVWSTKNYRKQKFSPKNSFLMLDPLSMISFYLIHSFFRYRDLFTVLLNKSIFCHLRSTRANETSTPLGEGGGGG